MHGGGLERDPRVTLAGDPGQRGRQVEADDIEPGSREARADPAFAATDVRDQAGGRADVLGERREDCPVQR